jgi:hypothetical protein
MGTLMYRTVFAALAFFAMSAPAWCRQRVYVSCEKGGQKVTVLTYTSSTNVQASYPGCTVTVYQTASAAVTAGTFTTGGTHTGSVGQTCNLSFTGTGNPSGGGTATVALTGTNNIAIATALTILTGGGYAVAPTAATLSSGTATCSGTANVVTTLGALTLATLYSDNNGTAQSNPFTASSTGVGFFHADDGYYDVQLSGGGLSSPVTFGAINLNDAYFLATGSDAVPRIKESKLADFVSIKDYGAKCDGNTDDTAAIQRAINATISTGQSVYAPGGVCVISGLVLLEGQVIYGEGDGSRFHIIGNNSIGISINGGHARVMDLRFTKAAGTTGVKAIVINPSGNLIASYNKLERLRIEGYGYGDLINSGIVVQSGTAAGCGSGADCGSFYTTINDTDIRFATNGVHVTSTDPLVGANGTSGTNVRIGDSVNCWRITRGDTNRVFALGLEGCTKGIWIETGAGGANNNGSAFIAPRFEANTQDVVIDSISYYNAIIASSLDQSKISDNGGTSMFISVDGLMKLAGGITYTATDAYLRFNPVSGIRSAGQTASYYAFGGSLTSDQTYGSASMYQIKAPNTAFGFPLAIMADSTGYGLGIVSQDFSASGNTGTGIYFTKDGHVTPTKNGSAQYAPLIVPQLKIDGGGAGSAGTITSYLSGTTTYGSGTALAADAVSSVDVTVSGCSVGDLAMATHSGLASNAIIISSTVRASSTIYVLFLNKTGAPYTIPSGTVRASCWKTS